MAERGARRRVLDLAGWRSLPIACLIANEVVANARQEHFWRYSGIDADAMADDAVHALRYFQATSRLRSIGLECHTPDIELLLELREHAETAEELSDSGNGTAVADYYGGEPWKQAFYTELLGLFWAIFDERPTASHNPSTGKGPSAAMVFVRSIFEETADCDPVEALDVAYADAGMSVPPWSIGTDSALAKHLGRVIGHDSVAQIG